MPASKTLGFRMWKGVPKGGNTTAGELYTTPVRTTAHGMSAGIAKCGGLWAAVWFNYLDSRMKFWFTACALILSLSQAPLIAAFGLCVLCYSCASLALTDSAVAKLPSAQAYKNQVTAVSKHGVSIVVLQPSTLAELSSPSSSSLNQ